MTSEFEYLLYLFSCGAKGENPVPPEKHIDWEFLFKLAENQTIAATVACALKKLPDNTCPPELLETGTWLIRNTAVSSMRRTELVLDLLNQFEKVEIKSAILKGINVAACYAVPECRLSGDTDILINPKDEAKALNLLQENGFTIIPRYELSHHTICTHPQIGELELHRKLYDEIAETAWFPNLNDRELIRENYELHSTIDGNYYSLGKTDNLLFITLHLIKHFIAGCMNLRMLMDVALFYKTFGHGIDTHRYWNTLNKYHYNKLFSVLLGSMIKYCGFSKADFPGMDFYDDENVLMILNDLETVGYMDQKTEEIRRDSRRGFTRRKLIKKEGHFRYKIQMFIWGGYLSELFPPREKVATWCPYVMYSVLLLPVAWVHMVIIRGRERISNGRIINSDILNETPPGEMGSNRINMFEKLGMI